MPQQLSLSDLNTLGRSYLFAHIPETEILSIYKSLDGRLLSFNKGELIWAEGKEVTELGIVLEGQVQIEAVDVWGDTIVINTFEAADSFGEAFATQREVKLNASVFAKKRSRVVFLNMSYLFQDPEVLDLRLVRLAQNIMQSIAKKNLHFQGRLHHMAPKTIREKLLAYFSDLAKEQRSLEIVLPYSRQELANYLCVDRSAMSSVLSKMQVEGTIELDKQNLRLNL